MNVNKMKQEKRPYGISLDIGTNSVGWALFDWETGDIPRKGGEAMLGVHLFEAGNTAADARLNRGQRRRYSRRRDRIAVLQEIFKPLIEPVDPTFFERLNQFHLHKEDRDEDFRDYEYMLFSNKRQAEAYYRDYPTVYHLRNAMMNATEQEDIRLVYLACAHIVKNRGHFLNEGDFTAASFDVSGSVRDFIEALQNWFVAKGIGDDTAEDYLTEMIDDVVNIIKDHELTKGRTRDDLQDPLSRFVLTVDGELCSLPSPDTFNKKILIMELTKAIAGYVADWNKIGCYALEKEDAAPYKISFTDEEKTEVLRDLLQDDEATLALYERTQVLYSTKVLTEILTTQGLSASKILSYETYGKELKTLKQLVRKYVPKKYDEVFRGEKYKGTKRYNKSKAKGYTLYDLDHSPAEYDTFKKYITELLDKTDAVNDTAYMQIKNALNEGTFLRRPRSSDNIAIPHQLQLEELTRIIDNQGKYYPSLLADKDKIEAIIKFRIPYYVGPLTQKNAAKDKNGNNRFAWSVRYPGKENDKIYPWNWDTIIDKDACAEAFMKRLVGDCSYLLGEKVLPRHSLLYEEYCLLDELNAVKFTIDGDFRCSFTENERKEILHDLFGQGSVSHKKLVDYCKQHYGYTPHEISGTQDKSKFVARLGSLIFFSKDVFNVDVDDIAPGSEYYETAENIIRWCATFEDKGILRDRITKYYGNASWFSQKALKNILRHNFKGWGEFSQKLLDGIKVENERNLIDGTNSVIEVMRDGYIGSHGKVQYGNFMQILHNDDLGFQKVIAEHNNNYLADKENLTVNDLPGSPAVRRPVNRSKRIVDELTDFMGYSPEHIVLESTRDASNKKKGKESTQRYKQIENALKVYADESGANKASIANVKSELKGYEEKKAALADERLFLYFLQCGKDAYTGKALNINSLQNYHVDHIIPQSYIKDDSISNKVLTSGIVNCRKSNSGLVDAGIQKTMYATWNAWHSAKLMDDKKFNNLNRRSISENQKRGFIARQLVETSQAVKRLQDLIAADERYNETNVRTVKAGISSQLRKVYDWSKCREANDFHHAHDAYLAGQVARMITIRFSELFDNPVFAVRKMDSYIKRTNEYYESQGKTWKASEQSFIVNLFIHSSNDVDYETGEVFEWDADRVREQIEKVLNYRSVHITRALEENDSNFWKATIYSPYEKNPENLIRIKNDLDPKKYGGYSSQQFAYWILYAVKTVETKKNGKVVEGNDYRYIGVPVNVAKRINTDKKTIAEYLNELCEQETNGYNDKGKNIVVSVEKIVIPKVKKFQHIRFNGSEMFMTGIKEARYAAEIGFTLEELSLIKKMLEDKATDSEIISLYETILDLISKNNKMLYDNLMRELSLDSFTNNPIDEKKRLLTEILNMTRGQQNQIRINNSSKARLVITMNKKGNRITIYNEKLTDICHNNKTYEL